MQRLTSAKMFFRNNTVSYVPNTTLIGYFFSEKDNFGEKPDCLTPYKNDLQLRGLWSANLDLNLQVTFKK